MRTRILMAALWALACIIHSSAFADFNYLENSGLWGDGSVWSRKTPPTNLDTAFISAGDKVATISIGETYSVDALVLGGTANVSGLNALRAVGGSLQVNSNAFFSREADTRSEVRFEDGAFLSVGGALRMGIGSGSSAVLSFTGASALQLSNIMLSEGIGAYAGFSLAEGASATIGGALRMAVGAGASASVKVSHSTLSLTNATLSAGWGSQSLFQLANGASATVNTLTFGSGASSVCVADSSVSLGFIRAFNDVGAASISLSNAVFSWNGAWSLTGTNASSLANYALAASDSTLSGGSFSVGEGAALGSLDDMHAARAATFSGNTVMEVSSNIVVGGASSNGGSLWLKDKASVSAGYGLQNQATGMIAFGITNATMDGTGAPPMLSAVSITANGSWALSDAELEHWQSGGEPVTIHLIQSGNPMRAAWPSLIANIDDSRWSGRYGELQVLEKSGFGGADTSDDAYSVLWIDDDYRNIYLTMAAIHVPEPLAVPALAALVLALAVWRQRHGAARAAS